MSFWCLHFLPKKPKTTRQVVKSNLFIRFLEETSPCKNHFKLVWQSWSQYFNQECMLYMKHIGMKFLGDLKKDPKYEWNYSTYSGRYCMHFVSLQMSAETPFQRTVPHPVWTKGNLSWKQTRRSWLYIWWHRSHCIKLRSMCFS
jgi:hypothetical protein